MKTLTELTLTYIPRSTNTRVIGITKRSWFYHAYPYLMAISIAVPLTIVFFLAGLKGTQ